MKKIYQILEAIENHFKNNEKNTNTVKFGDFDETDLNKTTLFPLTHFNVSRIEYNRGTIDFTLSLMVLDVVDENKEYDGSFVGATNLQDVLNTQATVLNVFVDSLRANRGYLAEKKFIIKNDPIAEYLSDKYENKLAGWGMDIEISTPNDDIKNCIVG